MKKQKLSAEQKRLETDIWIIALVTLGVFLFYAATGKQLMSFIGNSNISVIPRLLLNAGVQFGVAGLGITIVCILRKENFTHFGLIRKNILITDDVIASGIPFSILGMALIVLVWGFFEGFNYVVICDKINRRYPTTNEWLDYGAITCAIVCILFHPFSTSFWGIVEMITTFIAIYGMLIVKKKTGNAWGCVFAFCFIWNAI